MASLKRKHDEVDDFEDDEPAYGKQILPVANLPNDFNEEPMDGMQYLFTVRRDARQRPDVLRAPNPYEQSTSHDGQPPGPQDGDESRDAQNSRLPSAEWRELFTYRFLNFRKNIDQPTIHVGPLANAPRRLMPDKKDRDMWWAFLEGGPESEWTPLVITSNKPTHRGMRAWADGPRSSKPLGSLQESSQMNDEGEVERVLRVDPAESLPSPVGTPIPLDYLEGSMQPYTSTDTINRPLSIPGAPRPREPTTILLKQVDERMALHLLMYFTHWMNLYLKSPALDDHVPRESHARWIFALLSRVGDYISADDMNLLRNLARASLALIKEAHNKSSSTASTSISESSCWIIMTLVADIWKQRDLWIDAEAVIKSYS